MLSPMSRFLQNFCPIALPCVAGLLLLTPTALAQSKEFTLKPDGQWTMTKQPAPGSDEAIIAQARVDILNREYSIARTALNEFIDSHEGTNNPYLPAAHRLRGDAKLGLGKEESALRDYEEVIKNFPGSEEFDRALEKEHGIGKQYLNGLKRRLFWIRFDNGEPLGEEILIRVCERKPGSILAEKSLLDLIDYYYRKPDLKMAGIACRIYLGWLRNDEGSLSDLARISQVSPAYSKNEMIVKMRLIQASVLRFAGPEYNAAPLEDAKLLIEQFSSEYPNEAERTGIGDAMAARVDELLAQQMLEAAEWYGRRDDDVSARFTYRKLARKYPQTVAASRAIDVLQRKGWGMGTGARLKPAPARATPLANPPVEDPNKPTPAPKPAAGSTPGTGSGTGPGTGGTP